MNPFESDNVVDKTLIVRRLSANMAIRWFTSAFAQFKAFPFIWITFALIYFSVHLLGLLHPVLHFLSFLVLPLLYAGLFIAANTGDQKQTPHIENLIALNKSAILKLIMVGIVWGFISLLFSEVFIAFALAGFTASQITPENLSQHINSLPLTTVLLLIALLLGLFYLSVAYTLTPGLILFNGLTPFAAWRFAISACLQNWRVMLLYFFILSVFSLLATIPFFLGWIILLPVLILTHFYIWKSIFGHSVITSKNTQ